MKLKTINTIKQALQEDPTVTMKQAAEILRVCADSCTAPQLLSAKEVMQLLDISRPTLRAWARQGKVEEIRLSSRKYRYRLPDVY